MYAEAMKVYIENRLKEHPQKEEEEEPPKVEVRE